MIFTPLQKLIGIALSIVIFFGFGVYVTRRHYVQQIAQEQTKRDIESAKIKAEADERIRERDRMSSMASQNIRDYYLDRERKAKEESDRYIADLRAGRSSLYVPVTACRRNIMPSVPNSSGRTNGQEIAELDPIAAAALAGIAREGDAAIRQLGALQDWVKQQRDIYKN